MADDLNKNITITVTAETDKLQENITNLNKIIDSLTDKQKQLSKAGKTTSAAFQNNADKLDIFNKSLQNATTQLNSYLTALNSSVSAVQKNQTLITALTAAKDKYSKSTGDSSKKVKELNEAIKTLSAAAQQGDAQTAKSQSTTDKHTKSLGDNTKQAKTTNSSLNEVSSTLNKQESAANKSKASTDKHTKSLGDSAKQAKTAKSGLSEVSSALSKQASSTDKSKAATDKHAKSLGDNAKQAKSLKTGISGVSSALSKQQTEVTKNKTAFDLHKATMDHLKTSFDEIKGISGEFGPSLQDVAQGFNAMKSGLAVVKDGLTGVGDALKADGFDFLLIILQKIFDAFVNSSQGTEILQRAISAIGVVVNKVSDFINAFKTGFMDALTHPLDSIKELGRLVEQNIINRFKAFSVILDGIIHLDFKKIANGAIQAVSGVTDVTDKIVTVFNKAKDGAVKLGTEMVTAYQAGSKGVNDAAADNVASTNKSVDKQIAKYKKLGKVIDETKKKEDAPSKTDNNETPTANNPNTPTPKQAADPNDTETIDELNKDQAIIDEQNYKKKQEEAKQATQKIIADYNQQQADNKKKEDDARKARNKQIEQDAKQVAEKIATDGLNTLENSIKQQSEAKIAALEKEKDSELSNTSLTSAQKAAIEAKFKKQEDQVKAKAFKQEQEISIAQAVINGALAVTKATSQTGILAELAVPIIIAETAVEIAKIASQKPPAYAKGGLHYASDGRGGLLPGYSRTDNTNAYLRSGEGIVVSEAMRDPWARNLVSAINVGFGGRDFSVPNAGNGYAVGGIFTDGGDANRYYNQPVNDNKNLANTLAYQMINNFPPVYVDVKDINNQQNILAQTINRVTL